MKKTAKKLLSKVKSKLSKAKKVVRKVVELPVVIDARCAYDTKERKWALVDDKYNIVRHFSHGVMRDVRFVYNGDMSGNLGCVGIAKGKLTENDYGKSAVGFTNIQLKGIKFCDGQGSTIHSAQELRLLKNRSALVKI